MFLVAKSPPLVTKQQLFTYSIQSGDTSGVFVPDSLSSVLHVFTSGYLSNINPTVSGTTITYTYTNPGSTQTGSILVIGT